jgi:hypothetical protein
MVHKNYQWNISKEEGRLIIYDLLYKILNEQKNNSIEFNELIFLLNNRSKHITLINHKKNKNIINFIKTNYGGLQQFIDDYDIFGIKKINKQTIICLCENLESFNINDWVLINDL